MATRTKFGEGLRRMFGKGGPKKITKNKKIPIKRRSTAGTDINKLKAEYPRTHYGVYGKNKGYAKRDIRMAHRVFGEDPKDLDRYVTAKKKVMRAFKINDREFEEYLIGGSAETRPVRNIDDLEIYGEICEKTNRFLNSGMSRAKDIENESRRGTLGEFPAPINNYEKAQVLAGKLLLDTSKGDSEEAHKKMRGRLANIHISRMMDGFPNKSHAKGYLDKEYEAHCRKIGDKLYGRIKTVHDDWLVRNRNDPRQRERNLEDIPHTPKIPNRLLEE